jgi:hypothetical protein
VTLRGSLLGCVCFPRRRARLVPPSTADRSAASVGLGSFSRRFAARLKLCPSRSWRRVWRKTSTGAESRLVFGWLCAALKRRSSTVLPGAPSFAFLVPFLAGLRLMRLREKLTEHAKNPPQALKRGHLFYVLTARLKSCPSQNTLDPEFFRHF